MQKNIQSQKTKKSIIILYQINNEKVQEDLKNQILDNMNQTNANQMANMNLIDIIKIMPEEERKELISNISKKIDKMSDSILKQAAIAQIKEEYIKIGIDVDKK